MAAKEYSCVKKTKRAFENSLAELAKGRPLNKITVKMLCEKAQLSRNAFYFHYEDINDLINEIEKGIYDAAVSRFDEYKKMGFPKNVRASIVSLIELIESRREACSMLFDHSDTFTEKMSRAFCDFNYQYYEAYHGKDKVNRTNYDFYYMFISSGFYGLLKYWLDNPGMMSKNELVGLTYILIKRLLVTDNPDIEKISRRES